MDKSTQEEKRNNNRTPDAYMINAFYLRTNDLGQREVVLMSPLITHYQYDDTSLFQKPVIRAYKNNEEWHITAKRATGIHGAQTFYLNDNVKIRQLPSKKSADTLISTQSLTAFPKENLVTTKDPVTIEQPGLKVNAIGLKGDLKTGNIQLLSKTRGEYDPKQTH